MRQQMQNSNGARKHIPMSVILVLVWVIPAALAILETYTFARLAGRPFSIASIFLREGTTWVVYGMFAPLVYKLANRYPLRAPSLASNIARHFCAAMILGAIAAAASASATRFTLVSTDLPALRAMSFTRMFSSWFLGGLPVAIISYFAVVGVAHAVSYFCEAQQQREDALRLERQLADARLAALQGRLHPHFLYNTLNAITVLVRDGDIVKSTRMLELLSTMLRRVLDGSLPQVVSLRTELALLRQYLEIEEVRFSDRLVVAIDIDDQALDAGVPALLTQPLAENVIRHAVANTSRPVTLAISARLLTESDVGVLELSVEDDGPGLTAGWEQRSRDHTGLSATRMRLATLYGQAASLVVRAGSRGGTISVAQIPYEFTPTTTRDVCAASTDTTDETVMALAT
jgi:two-component system LytT family sensor kinase